MKLFFLKKIENHKATLSINYAFQKIARYIELKNS